MFTLFHQQYSHVYVRRTCFQTMWRRFKVSNQVIIFIILLFSKASCKNECPTDKDVIQVELNKMVGEWFMVAGTPVTEKVGACLHFDVQVTDSNEFFMNFTTTSYRNGQRLWWNVEGRQLGKQMLATWQLSSSTHILGPFQHQILAINYDSYLAMIVCANDTSLIRRKKFAMIWSRTHELPRNVLDELKEEIARYVDPSNIFDVDNSCNGVFMLNKLE